MKEINYFEDTPLKELKTKFEELTKGATNEDKQIIGLKIVFDKYQQLFKQVNTIRKGCGLSTESIENIPNFLDIKNKYNKLIDDLNHQIEEIKKKSAEVVKAAEGTSLKPINPQESSSLVKIAIGDKIYRVEVAYTDEEKELGLSNRDSLEQDSGMLFIWDEPETVSMWMKDTKIPLDLVFIDEELSVVAVHQGVPDSEDIIEENNILFVLEVNIDSGIQVGDDLEFSPDDTVKKDIMVVLDENGDTQMELDGGERIFSRTNTKTLIKFAKKAKATGKDSDYKALGKRVFKFLEQQNKRKPEFVQE